MRAALLESVGTDLVVVGDAEIEAPHPGEVGVRVSHCGVCHSDLHYVDGQLPGPLPLLLGHEAAGVVEAVGAGVRGLAEGDKVILTLRPPCGRCYFCARGEAQLCSDATAVLSGTLPDGGTRLAHRGRTVYRGVGLGAFGEQVVTPASGAVKVPDDTPLEVACLLGCAVQTGVGAVLNTARVPEGATVAVVGLGGIGISVVQGARLAGASRIIGVDPLQSRREQAARFGVTDAVDPGAAELAAVAVQETEGVGLDFAFDTAARPATISSCLDAVRPGGTVTVIGVPHMDDQIAYPALFLAMTEKRLQGCFLGSSNPHREFPRLLALWRAGRLDLEAMVTATRPLEEVNQAFTDMRNGVGLRSVLALA